MRVLLPGLLPDFLAPVPFEFLLDGLLVPDLLVLGLELLVGLPLTVGFVSDLAPDFTAGLN
jgi:hypothetical protein